MSQATPSAAAEPSAPAPAPWAAAGEQRYQEGLQRLRLAAQQSSGRMLRQLLVQRVRAVLAAGQQAAADGADPLLLLSAAARLTERARLWREQQQQQQAAVLHPGSLPTAAEAPPPALLDSSPQEEGMLRPAKRQRAGRPPRPY